MIFRACTWCGKQSGLGISRMYQWLQADQPGHLKESAGCCNTTRVHAGQPWSTCMVQLACRPCTRTQCPWPTCIVISGALSPASLLSYFFLETWVPEPSLPSCEELQTSVVQPKNWKLASMMAGLTSGLCGSKESACAGEVSCDVSVPEHQDCYY